MTDSIFGRPVVVNQDMPQNDELLDMFTSKPQRVVTFKIHKFRAPVSVPWWMLGGVVDLPSDDDDE